MTSKSADGYADRTRASKGQEGIALLIALAALSVISLLVLKIVDDSGAAARLGFAARGEMELHQAELSALEIMAASPDDYAIFHNGASKQVVHRFGDVSVTMSVRPEAAKLDINSADEAVLSKFLARVTGGVDEGNEIAAAIADWRDPDTLTRLNGAEAAVYRGAGLAYEPANAGFTSIDQLRFVYGINDRLFFCIRPYMTVSAGASVPDLKTADPFLAEALGGRLAGPIPPTASIVGTSAGRGGEVFEVRLEMTNARQKTGREIVYVIRMVESGRHPFTILDRQPIGEWRENSNRTCRAAQTQGRANQ